MERHSSDLDPGKYTEKLRTKIDLSSVNAASSSPEIVNPRNDFNTLLKTGDKAAEDYLQNAKPDRIRSDHGQ